MGKVAHYNGFATYIRDQHSELLNKYIYADNTVGYVIYIMFSLR